MADIIQIRRDTASQWTTINPILAQGELGMELDTLKFKVGDATTAWNSLPYLWDSPGGTKILYNADGTYVKAANFKLTEFYIKPGSNTTVRVGSTLGGDEYFPDTYVTSAAGNLFTINLFSLTADTLYFTGLNTGSFIIFFNQYFKVS